MMTRSLDVGSLESYMEDLYALPVSSLREQLKAFAKEHRVAI
jgi:hypothetical protein